MIKVYSHPRSGTNYLAALIGINIYPGRRLGTGPGVVGHWADRARVRGNPYGRIFGGHGLPRHYAETLSPTDCYIFRDGRDVAVSLWNSAHFINPEWKRGTFAQFLRQPLDWVCSPGDKKLGNEMTIFEHWRWHLETWQKANVIMVRYEELCNDVGGVMRRIASVAGVELGEVKLTSGLSGWFPSHGKPGAWREIMTRADRRLFANIAGDCYGVSP